MSTIATDSETWVGHVLTDRKDRKIGKIADIYYDEQTERPTWMLVKLGMLGSKHTLVPLAGAVATAGKVRTPHPKPHVDGGPLIDPAANLGDDELSDIFHHYDVPLLGPGDRGYTPVEPLVDRVLQYTAAYH